MVLLVEIRLHYCLIYNHLRYYFKFVSSPILVYRHILPVCDLDQTREVNITTGSKYILRSINFPNDFDLNLNCFWLFETDQNGTILLQVDFLDLDFLGDSFTFGDGLKPELNDSIILHTTWGYKLRYVWSVSSRMWISLKTDHFKGTTAFQFTVRRSDGDSDKSKYLLLLL